MINVILQAVRSNKGNVKIQLFDKINRPAMKLPDAINSLDFALFSRTIDSMIEAEILIECRSTRNNEPEGWNFGLMANPNPPKEIAFCHLPFRSNTTQDLAFLFAPVDNVPLRGCNTHVNGTETIEVSNVLAEDTFFDDNETNFDISLPMLKM